MPTYTFSEYDMGNSPIVPDQEGPVSFTTSTERGFMDMQKHTTVIPLNSGTEDRALGVVVDWKKKTMEFNGKTKPMAEVKRKTGGTLSLTHEWQWSTSTKKYVITYKKGVWTAKCGDEPVVVYTPLKPHPFKKDELATMNFLSDVSTQEMAFLIFVLLFHDLKLPPKQKPLSLKAAAGEAGGNVAGNVAGNVVSTAVSGGCSIQ